MKPRSMSKFAIITEIECALWPLVIVTVHWRPLSETEHVDTIQSPYLPPFWRYGLQKKVLIRRWR